MKMKEIHTFYNFQFKHTAVRITNHPNIQASHVADALKIHPIMLYRWRQEMRDGKIEDNDKEARMARKFKKHNHRHHLITDPHNLLLQREPPSRANEVWVGDVTYIRVGKDWNYLCTVMDLHARQIIGWHFAKNVNAKLVMETLLMAIGDQCPKQELIFHTDRGVEFYNKEVYGLLDEYGIANSKSRAGHCWDNAAMESFFHTLKTEMVYFHRFKSLVDAVSHIMSYLRFYNHDRLHSGLNYQTPVAYGEMAA